MEEKKSNKFINILIFSVIIIVSIFIYAKYVGTSGIRVKEYRVASKKIPEGFSGIKLIYISDILLGSISNSHLESIVNEINSYKPDIVIMGGNLISEDYKLSKKEKKEVINILNNINDNLGKYYVNGDLDNKIYDEIATSANFISINNKNELIYNESNDPICLVGVSSYNKVKYKLEDSFNYTNDCYSIMVTHEGDIANKVLKLDKRPDVILAGNSLGGLLDIPFYGPLFKFSGSMEYYLDYIKEKNVEIYVSSGIGTRNYNLRLNNRPSFSLFRLKSIH